MPVPSPSSTPSPATANSWGPYSNAGDFKGNMLIILPILFCTLILFLAINSIIRFFLCRCCLPLSSDPEEDPEKQKARKEALPVEETHPTLVFSRGMELAGTIAECAICLSEFVDGDRVRVLPACNHGFHVKCVEEWLALRCSCPTCRRICCGAVGTMENRGMEEV